MIFIQLATQESDANHGGAEGDVDGRHLEGHWIPPVVVPQRPQVVRDCDCGACVRRGHLVAALQDDGAALADAQMVLVVTVNYRLGLFGAMAHPALDAESGGSGAWGAHDVVLALKWVQNNIAAFGGDPAKVTLMGQDTGAVMVVQLMCAQPAQGVVQVGALLGVRDAGERAPFGYFG